MTQLQASLKPAAFPQQSKEIYPLSFEIKTFLEQFCSFILSCATKKAKSEAQLVQKGESDMLEASLVPAVEP